MENPIIINYEIITPNAKVIETNSEVEIHYDFLLGSISLISSDNLIEMNWDWIPLLDFAFCLKVIFRYLDTNIYNREYFEFTENGETLEFIKDGDNLKIVASFTTSIIETTFTDFEKAVNNLNISISEYILKNITNEPPSILQKYLSI